MHCIITLLYNLNVYKKAQIAQKRFAYERFKISAAYDLSCGELKPLVGEVCASDAIYYILQI